MIGFRRWDLLEEVWPCRRCGLAGGVALLEEVFTGDGLGVSNGSTQAYCLALFLLPSDLDIELSVVLMFWLFLRHCNE